MRPTGNLGPRPISPGRRSSESGERSWSAAASSFAMSPALAVGVWPLVKVSVVRWPLTGSGGVKVADVVAIHWWANRPSIARNSRLLETMAVLCTQRPQNVPRVCPAMDCERSRNGEEYRVARTPAQSMASTHFPGREQARDQTHNPLLACRVGPQLAPSYVIRPLRLGEDQTTGRYSPRADWERLQTESVCWSRIWISI
jgi:hypothetical protein